MALKHPDNRFAVCNNNGTTYAERDTSDEIRVDHQFANALTNTLFDDGGTYDIDQGASVASLKASKLAYCNQRRAGGADRIVGSTMPPTIIFDAAQEAVRVAHNAALLADPKGYGYDRIIDIAGIPELQNPNDAAYYFDGTHWTDAGTTLVAQKFAQSGE